MTYEGHWESSQPEQRWYKYDQIDIIFVKYDPLYVFCAVSDIVLVACLRWLSKANKFDI